MHTSNNYRELHNSDTHNCFACSPANQHGLRMKIFTDETKVVSWLTVPEYMGGWDTIVHGGIVSTILDEIMGWAGLVLLKKVTLTNSMTIDFIKALHVDKKLRAEGSVTEFNGKRHAAIEGFLYNQKNELCAKATGDFTVLTPQLAKRIGIMTDDHIKDFFEPLINPSA